MWIYRSIVIAFIVAICYVTSGHAQNDKDQQDRVHEVDGDALILLNVGAKGRVVELLANELARTEIIRALLVEYARECAHNVSVLEKHCIDCMMERCQNRLLECDIKTPPLSEVISHKTSPIKGLEFLSKSPEPVQNNMKQFIRYARKDILRDVPDKLMKESVTIVEDEVDQSLKDLYDNMDPEKTLQSLTLHVHDANGVQTTSDLNGVVVVIQNGGRNVNIAELLHQKLKQSRPALETIKENGAKALEQMPSVVERVGLKINDFKHKISGIVGSLLDKFQESLDEPDTAVVNGNAQQFATNMNQGFPPNGNMPGFNQVSNVPQGQMAQNFPNMMPVQAQFNQIPQGRFNGQQFQGQQQFQQGQTFNSAGFPSNQRQPISNVQIQPLPTVSQTRNQFSQNPNPNVRPNTALQNMVDMIQQGQGQNQGQMFQNQLNIDSFQGQSQGLQNQIQGQNFQGQSNGQAFQAQQQGQAFQGQAPGQAFQGQRPGQAFQSQAFQGQPQGQAVQGQTFQGQTQMTAGQSQGRRKREIVACTDLRSDPETHCRKFESDCHNCTLEKRLRFEVCGDGVERARDEIKRLDNSVVAYLEAFKKYIMGSSLILKIELNDNNRLHKSDSYNDAYITAKIGPSILRFKSQMVLNINNIRVSGSQIGDELWEKLWEKEVFKEADRVIIPPKENDIMGQTHNLKTNNKDNNVTNARLKAAASASRVSIVAFVFSIVSSVFVFLI